MEKHVKRFKRTKLTEADVKEIVSEVRKKSPNFTLKTTPTETDSHKLQQKYLFSMFHLREFPQIRYFTEPPLQEFQEKLSELLNTLPGDEFGYFNSKVEFHVINEEDVASSDIAGLEKLFRTATGKDLWKFLEERRGRIVSDDIGIG
jgi:hypothetical protein